MATEGGIKQDLAAARSLLRHLEQAQARWLARLASQAPEIDGVTFLAGEGFTVGELVPARVTGVRGGVDLEAVALE